MTDEQYKFFISTIEQFRKEVEEVTDLNIESVDVINEDAEHIRLKFVLSTGINIISNVITLPPGPQGPQGIQGIPGATNNLIEVEYDGNPIKYLNYNQVSMLLTTNSCIKYNSNYYKLACENDSYYYFIAKNTKSTLLLDYLVLRLNKEPSTAAGHVGEYRLTDQGAETEIVYSLGIDNLGTVSVNDTIDIQKIANAVALGKSIKCNSRVFSISNYDSNKITLYCVDTVNNVLTLHTIYIEVSTVVAITDTALGGD